MTVQDIFADAPECVVCGTRRRDNHLRLTHFKDERYATVIRCRESYQCRETVEASGKDWPLNDRTAAPLRRLALVAPDIDPWEETE